jgi:serine/threonine-protein kinase
MTTPDVDSPDDMIGRRFGEGFLVIQKKLGEGGMGTVYLAWDSKHNRAVAIKFLRPERFVDREMVTRFKREGRKFAGIRHENLVRIYALGREQGLLYIASEFIDGRNLYEILADDGPFTPERGLVICRDAALGLHEAHKFKVVHRDLKPENIMIRNEDEKVKVLDFGIAKDLDASVGITRMGTYLGTPAYSAPEQIRGEDIDHRADIFSMGVILYELLTGKVAFDGRHTTEVLHATMRDRPIPIGRINDSVVRPVADLINQMIEKKPRKRPADMQVVIDTIDDVLVKLKQGFSEEEKSGVMGMLKSIFQGS